MKKQFCESQIKAKEDTPYTWTCAAHLAEGRAHECHYKNFAASKSGQYPCMDAKEVEVVIAKYEKKEGECDRCRMRMNQICASDSYGNRTIYWCTMCGAVQIATYRSSVFDTLGDTSIEFKYPEMTADLPCDSE